MTTTPWAVPASITSAIQQKIAALDDLRIVIGEPVGKSRLDDTGMWVRIGAIVVHYCGVIEVLPCIDASFSQIAVLIRKAEAIRVDGPTGPNWTYDPDLGLLGSIFEPCIAPDASPSESRLDQRSTPEGPPHPN